MDNILFENDTYRIVYDVETKAIDINVKEDMSIDWFEHVGNVEDVANGWLKGSGNIEKVLEYIKEELGIIPTINSDAKKDILKEFEVAKPAFHLSNGSAYPDKEMTITRWPVNANKKGNKKMLTRKEMLQKVEQIVCMDREKQYGSPEDNFTKIAKLWNAYLGKDDISPADVAVMMALLKIARISSGEYKEDSWVDLAGYAICGGAIASMEDD